MKKLNKVAVLFAAAALAAPVAVFAQAILSFVAPRGPATAVLASLTRPFLSLFQRRVPPVGGVDLSPLFVLVICQIMLIWPLDSLERAVGRML